MAGNLNPYDYGGNPSDVGSGYNPSTDPNAGYTYTPPPPSNPSDPLQYGSNYGGAPTAPYVPPSSVGGQQPIISSGATPSRSMSTGGTSTPGAAPAATGPGGINWGDVFNPPWMGTQSQEWLSFMMGPQGVAFQNQLAQQQADLQKQIQTAAYTGDWNGVQTLQSKLQETQTALAKNQADMNNVIGLGNLTGQYNGHATLQAQDAANNMALQARGQDVNMAQIQAQLAQSPLVAWYTARGLPPPTTAIMKGPAAWDPKWDWASQQGPDALLGTPYVAPTPPPTAATVR